VLAWNAALSEYTGDATDPGDLAVAARRIVHGFFYAATLLEINVVPVEPLPDDQQIALTAAERAGLLRLVRRCQKTQAIEALVFLMTVGPEALEQVIVSSLSAGILDATLKSQVKRLSSFPVDFNPDLVSFGFS
jgi:hypothetical protein